MIVKNKFTDIEKDYSFRTWHNQVKNKESYIVVKWGDLVMARQIEKDNSRKDLYIIDRDHATRIIKSHPDRFDYRELSELDWGGLRKSVSESPELETDHLPQATPASQPKQKPEKNKSQKIESEYMTNRLLKIAPLGIWITGIVSLIVAVIGLILRYMKII